MEKSNVYSLAARRANREQARGLHPSIWTPTDAIDTANAFHAELDRAERGVAVDPCTVASVSWDQYQPRNRGCYIELTKEEK